MIYKAYPLESKLTSITFQLIVQTFEAKSMRKINKINDTIEIVDIFLLIASDNMFSKI